MTTSYLRLMAKRGSCLYNHHHHTAVGLLRRTVQQCGAHRSLSSTATHCYTPPRRANNDGAPLPGWNNKATPSSSSSSKPAHASRAEDIWGRSPRRQQQQQPQSRNQLQRWQPPKYKSLVHFPDGATLQYPHSHSDGNNKNKTKNFSLQCEKFAIAKPGHDTGGGGGGGHVLLGRNGCGKSLLVKYLSHPEQLLLDQHAAVAAAAVDDEDNGYDNDDNDYNDDWKLLHPSRVAHVSFESHLKLLTQQPHLRVHDAITGGRRGTLSPAAQYLIVRFGLKPLLHRTVSTLSTGEIRKCLLVAALARQPQLLILENAFDGLDVTSRQELKSIVCKTMQGLNQSGKLLVTQVHAESVAPAQVFLCTHRPEEIVDAIDTISMILHGCNDDDNHSNHGNHSNHSSSNNTLVTIQRPSGWSQEQLMNMALGLDKDHNKNKSFKVLAPWEVVDETLPTVQELHDFWNHDQQEGNNHDGQTASAAKSSNGSPLLTLDKVEIRRRRDGMTADDDDEQGKKKTNEFVTLLQPLSWEIASGQRWLIAGGNGAGKSTLSRFLLHSQNGLQGVVANDDCKAGAADDTTCDLTSGSYFKNPDATIGWVSTESHLGKMTEATNDEDDDKDESSSTVTTAWDVITHNGTASKSDHDMSQLVSWIFGSEADEALLKNCPFTDLSQGQQKLVLLASAVATRPKVLILDEPTQGLDWVHRCRVLSFLERLCQATDTSLVFITHYQEEWIPSISHVLHLHQGRVLYQGPKHGYNPAKLNDKIDEDEDCM